jgi:hypothetical protein
MQQQERGCVKTIYLMTTLNLIDEAELQKRAAHVLWDYERISNGRISVACGMKRIV